MYTPCMEKLDQLSWIDAFALSGYGARIGVRVSDRSLIQALENRLPPGVRHAPTGQVDRMLSVILGGREGRARKFHMAYADHAEVGRSHDLERALEGYDSHLRLALAQFSRPRLFIHGGAVAIDGKAILFPGNSLAGKSRLVAELLKAGADYLSDEYAVVTERAMVHPFEKPISLRQTPTARQIDVTAESLGARTVRRALPIGAVVLTEYREGARWAPQPVKPSHAALRMMQFTVGARTFPEPTLRILSAIAERVPVFHTPRPDTARAVPRLFQLAERLWGPSASLAHEINPGRIAA